MIRFLKCFLCIIFSFFLCQKFPEAAYANTLNIGDTFFFGAIEQDNNNASREAIEWYVIDVDGDKALLLSKHGLNVRQFSKKDSSWENSQLRQWLNEKFYPNSFSEIEQEAICQVSMGSSDILETDLLLAEKNIDHVFFIKL